MSTPPQTYSHSGYTLTLVEDSEDFAIYHQTGKTYEVIRKRVYGPNNRFKPGGFRIPAASEWGLHGWTCHTLKRARERLQKQQQEVERKLQEAVSSKIPVMSCPNDPSSLSIPPEEESSQLHVS